ncbi:MAG: heat-inducible transcriptional repressor HrcA [Christensenellales bacterium]
MDERKWRILQAIIDDYVATALPVGSRTISRKYLEGISSATIRNEMSDLEDLGYLSQPHVSAGRVPNAKAYRLYVDSLDTGRSLPPADEARIRRHIQSRVKQLEDVVASTAEVLSDMTRYAAVVMMPRQEELRISSLQLVPISRASALVVVVTDGGIMRDAFVHVSESLDPDALYAISRMLSEKLHHKTLGEARELLTHYAQSAPWDPQVLSGIAELATQLERQSASDNLKVSGTHNILSFPEYIDVDKARMVLSALNEKESLLWLLKEGSDLHLSVRIGPENGIPHMEELSVVTASYEVGRGHRGAIGVIGPTRMPYARVLSTLQVVGSTLSGMLRHHDEE